MADLLRSQPAIHVALLADAERGLERFVAFGAEEEGVPTRVVAAEAQGVVAAAYAAARSSSFGVGLGLGEGRIALHEGHMPPERPVIVAALGDKGLSIARRLGGNAARLVVGLPLRLSEEGEPAVSAETKPEGPSAAEVAALVAKLRDEGKLGDKGIPG